jgi:GNAT superfamily N-acetyltransferase
MKIELVSELNEKHWELLLNADPSMDMINRYIGGSDIFSIEDGGVPLCIAAVVPVSPDIAELKNLSVAEDMQKKGLGRIMVDCLFEYYKNRYRTMLVGTAFIENGCVGFYEKCGFEYAYTVKGFFTENYPEPIYENGTLITG